MSIRVGIVAPPELDRRFVDLIKQVLAEHLEKFGIKDVRITPGYDHDGDPVIFIDVELRVAEINAEDALEALSHLRRDLVERGEMRFPHLRNLLSEGHSGASSH